MTAETPLAEVSHNRLRLETLIRLRWMAVGGQSIAVLLVSVGFAYDLPLFWCFALIALSALLNVFLVLRYPTTQRLRSETAAAQLAYDILQLAGLLYLTGGLANPFAILFLAPVSVAATTLPQRPTLALSALVIAVATALAWFHMPLPWDPRQPLEIDPLYVAGVWVGLTFGVGFITVYTYRVAHEARQLSDALAATELMLSREQHISALDGLAAAAAHELGTPLATIATTAHELQSDTADPATLREDIDLIAEQVARCRAILGKLRSLDDGSPDPFSVSGLGDLLAEAAAPHRDFGVAIEIEGAAEGPEPQIRRTAVLTYGLGNLIENAVDHATAHVRISHRSTDRDILIEIRDDGPGFPPDLLARIGEPYLTARSRPGAAASPDGSEGLGLGLGIFIAKTLLERSGASLGFENTAGGALVTVAWPRRRLDAGTGGL